MWYNKTQLKFIKDVYNMKPLKYQLANGDTVYSIRVFVGTTSEGKKIIKSKKWQPDKKYTPNQLEKELQKQTLQFEKEIKQGIVIDEDVTFKEFSEIWLEKYSRIRHKLKTVDSYESMLKRINIAIGHIKLNKLSVLTINSFLNNLKESGTKLTDKNKQACLSDKSVKNYYILLSSIFRYCKEMELYKRKSNG
jgi:methionine aminopeptidase